MKRSWVFHWTSKDIFAQPSCQSASGRHCEWRGWAMALSMRQVANWKILGYLMQFGNSLNMMNMLDNNLTMIL